MYFSEYKKALSLGLKEFRACNAKGVFPYLPVLDDILENAETCGEVSLGLVDIPVELIVGTKSAGRKRAFSRSFLPLLEEDSELADKWVSLCRAHMEEGINEPIKVYEFMHNFYVQEGHKRVSVLRYFGAVTIPASVIRILPVRNGTLENKIYYEFLAFYQLSGINYLWFEQEGRFALLQSLVGKRADEVWSPEERKDFFSFYLHFTAAYKARAAKELPALPIGDAMLATMDFYGYDQLKDNLEAELKNRLTQIRETLEAAGGNPQEPRVKRLLQWLPQSIKLVKQPINLVTEAMNDSAKTMVEMADTLAEPVRVLIEGENEKKP